MPRCNRTRDINRVETFVPAAGEALRHATMSPSDRTCSMENESPLTRRHPARESPFAVRKSPIIFITACTKGRGHLLSNEVTHEALKRAWLDYKHWMVGPYVLMPDHLHLLVAPTSAHPSPVRRWVAWWKRLASQALHLEEDHLWQRDIWDYRLRCRDHFAEKARYILNNPVRGGLVEHADMWPYAGRIHHIG